MNFLKLDFGLPKLFDSDYDITWQDGKLGYTTLADGQDGFGNRLVTDPSVFLNYFYSKFVSIIYESGLVISSISSYKLEGKVDGKLFSHRVNETKKDIYQLIILHGNDNISYNTHNVSGLLEHNEVDGLTELSYYTEQGKDSLDSNALPASAVPITSKYTNCSFIANVSIPTSFTNQSGTGYVTCIVFPNAFSEQPLREALVKYII